MSKNQDSWCNPLYRRNKKPLYGGAARNVRISKSGGMDEIIKNVCKMALQQANANASDISKDSKVIPLKRKAA
ncbi:MAG: hypothetical protein ACOYMG_12560 [Candidatus Methylumidiphilus sp.]